MNPLINRFFILLLGCSVGWMNCSAQSAVQKSMGRSPLFLTDSLDKYIHTAMQMWRIPGVAVAIIKDGKVVHLKGYGKRWEWSADTVDVNTLFLIGSCTKAFTSTALAWLQQEGKMRLEDKVSRWIPHFRLYDSAASQLVTVRDLLCHRIGLETFQGDLVHWDSNLSRAEIVALLAKHRPKYPFRTQWGYCNAAYLTAGEVIPAVTGKSWDDFIRERFLQPLQLNRTFTYSDSIIRNANAARGHTIYEGRLDSIPYPHLDNFAAAASMSSSISDMSRWVQLLLNEGELEGKSWIPKTVLRETWQPQTFVSKRKNKFVAQNYQLYALGWVLEDYNGKEMISHTGGVDGFLTSVCLLPSERLGIVVLTNQDEQNFFNLLKNELIDYYLGLPYRNYNYLRYDDYAKNAKNNLDNLMKERLKCAKAMQAGLTTQLKWEDYVGTYEHEVYGTVTVYRKENRLKISFSKHPHVIGHLEYQGNHQFLCFYSNKLWGIHPLPFEWVDGKVKSFTMRVNDFLETEPYKFVKK